MHKYYAKRLYQEGLSPPISTANYTYDEQGNRLTKTDPTGTTNYSYSPANELTKVSSPPGGEGQGEGVITYTYDQNGNTLTKVQSTVNGQQSTSYTYDNKNQLVGVRSSVNGQPSATIEYVYDGNGNRYSKSINGVARYYSYDTSGNIVSEYTLGTSNQTRETLVRYVRDNTGKAMSMLQYPEPGTQNPVPSTYYFTYNGHGDVTALTDSSGSVVATYSYDEFGNITSETGTVYNPLRYSGANNAYYDSETSLYKMGTRYYQPDVGRWLTRDSFKGDQAEPQSKNRYIYVENNPITYFDATGHKKSDNKWPKEYIGTKKVLWFWPFGGGSATVKANAVLTMYKNSGTRAWMSVFVYGVPSNKYDIFGTTYAKDKSKTVREFPMGLDNNEFGSIPNSSMDSSITESKTLSEFINLRYGRPFKTRFDVSVRIPKADSYLLLWSKKAYIKRFKRRR